MEHSGLNCNSVAPPMPMPENYELMPLKKRLTFLLANRLVSFDSDHNQAQIRRPTIAGGSGSSSASQSGCSVGQKMTKTVSFGERQNGEPVGYNKKGSQASDLMISSQTADTSVGNSSLHQLSPPKHLDRLEFKHAGKCNGNLSNSQRGGSFQTAHLEPEMSAEDLDHLPLAVRLRRLLARKTLGPMEPPLKENCSGIFPTSATSHLQIAGTGRELTFGDRMHSMDNGQNIEIQKNSETKSTKCFVNPSSKPTRKAKSFGGESYGRKACPSAENGAVQYDATSKWSNIKIEPENYSELQNCNQLALAPRVNIKVELSDYVEAQLPDATPVGQMSSIILPVQKTEVEIHGDYQDDKLDHLLLRERMRLLSPKNEAFFNVSQSSNGMDRIESSLNFKRAAAPPVPSLKINRPRKRRKTATDSIETAMEEDAPGLLQELINKGVSINEIKLFGEPESNDALDDAQTENCFAGLEEVMAKLFSQRESLLKFGPMRGSKGEKASYCLECLFSLIEQARYLQFRNWPVEWGWCRDLQSFIFVFERHNRIVLERPEYGFATYFFELAESLPIKWQVKRLVIAMKLTNCSRITLIENKALKVGDDLSEGEANVLLQYGWMPDTGLGTMLNYYDRVYHDRKSEKDGSEWRSKIGKLLMDGYNGGSVVSSGIPSKVEEYNMAHPIEVKLELDY